MHTVTQPCDIDGELPPPHITPFFTSEVERAAERLGLPPDPWTA